MKDKKTTNIEQGLIPIKMDQNRGIILKQMNKTKQKNQTRVYGQ